MSKFAVLSNELVPLHSTGSLAPVPYHRGHNYVLLPGAGDGDGFLKMNYSVQVPDCVQNVLYRYELHNLEVTV